MNGRMQLLAHDVGKYLARTARNLPERPSPEIIEMLARDLYALRAGERASKVFSDLAEGIITPDLGTVRELFREIDALEPAVRAHDESAVRSAAALACEVERRLRDFAREGS
jgi:hypothetical protein